MIDTAIFKAYDVRALYPSQINPETAYLLGLAFKAAIRPGNDRITVGKDVRGSGDALVPALIKGLQDGGMEVSYLGTIATDTLYYAVASRGFGAGITVSASHNPAEYNGFKMVREDAKSISGDEGIGDIRDEMLRLEREGVAFPEFVPGPYETLDVMEGYFDKVAGFIDAGKLAAAGRRFRVAMNGNHGMTGVNAAKLIESKGLPVDHSGIYMEPDGSFPQGRPDPLYEDNRAAMRKLMDGGGFDFGVAWDADGDRCFFFDENGKPVHPYHATAMLTDRLLGKNGPAPVVYDPRLAWAIVETVEKRGGTPLLNKVGSSFIRARMRAENALFSGESSGHYFFRDFWFADNGLIPFLLVLEMLAETGKKLSELAASWEERYPIVDEMNLKLADPKAAMRALEEAYSGEKLDRTDGLTIESAEWRASVRTSNTEPVVRLNIEARSREALDRIAPELTARLSA